MHELNLMLLVLAKFKQAAKTPRPLNADRHRSLGMAGPSNTLGSPWPPLAIRPWWFLNTFQSLHFCRRCNPVYDLMFLRTFRCSRHLQNRSFNDCCERKAKRGKTVNATSSDITRSLPMLVRGLWSRGSRCQYVLKGTWTLRPIPTISLLTSGPWENMLIASNSPSSER
jgi:hypothetical protein